MASLLRSTVLFNIFNIITKYVTGVDQTSPVVFCLLKDPFVKLKSVDKFIVPSYPPFSTPQKHAILGLNIEGIGDAETGGAPNMFVKAFLPVPQLN